MLKVSRIATRRARIYNSVSLNLSSNGSLLMSFLTHLTLQIFVPFFLVLDLAGCPLLYTCIFGLCPLLFLINLLYLYKNKRYYNLLPSDC
jgi:hypothetical protein